MHLLGAMQHAIEPSPEIDQFTLMFQRVDTTKSASVNKVPTHLSAMEPIKIILNIMLLHIEEDMKYLGKFFFMEDGCL